MQKPVICISMGDPAGIGAEIIVKALGKNEIYNKARPVVIGSKSVIQDAISFIPSHLKLNIIKDIARLKGDYGFIDLVDLNNIQLEDFHYGEVSAAAGKASMEYIFKAIELAKNNEVDAVVTGPINKESINKAGYNYTGHTEIFAEKTNCKDYAMMLTSDEMAVIHVSTHVSLREAIERVKKERILKVIHLAREAMIKLGIKKPRIAVSGLNPHAGEGGLFGREEILEIVPAIEEARREGIIVEGPISPDTLFPKVRGKQYDIGVAMYHDQGHIPMKVTGFQYDISTNKWLSMSGVNATIGLPIIRTSVDHGVAYGKAGEGRANEESMINALDMAIKLSINQKK